MPRSPGSRAEVTAARAGAHTPSASVTARNEAAAHCTVLLISVLLSFLRDPDPVIPDTGAADVSRPQDTDAAASPFTAQS